MHITDSLSIIKVKAYWFGSAKWFSPAVSQRLLMLVIGHSEMKYRPEKSVINMM
jgi:hypothetical protein